MRIAAALALFCLLTALSFAAPLAGWHQPVGWQGWTWLVWAAPLTLGWAGLAYLVDRWWGQEPSTALRSSP